MEEKHNDALINKGIHLLNKFFTSSEHQINWFIALSFSLAQLTEAMAELLLHMFQSTFTTKNKIRDF